MVWKPFQTGLLKYEMYFLYLKLNNYIWIQLQLHRTMNRLLMRVYDI